MLQVGEAVAPREQNAVAPEDGHRQARDLLTLHLGGHVPADGIELGRLRCRRGRERRCRAGQGDHGASQRHSVSIRDWGWYRALVLFSPVAMDSGRRVDSLTP
jgi:hypothetical protein